MNSNLLSGPRLIIVDEKHLNVENTECFHEHRDSNGYCTDCGQWESVSGYSEIGSKRRKQVVKSIAKDLINLGHSGEVVTRADDIYQRIVSGSSGKRSKDKIVFWCAFQAYLQMGKSIDPFYMGRKQHGLTSSEISQSFTQYGSYAKTGYEAVISFVDPHGLIPYYCEILGIPDNISKIISDTYTKLLANHPEIEQRPVRPTLAAFIHLMLESHGYKINIDTYADIFSLSSSTVKSTRAHLPTE